MRQVRDVAPRLPDPALPNADWADSYEIELAGPVPARSFFERGFDHQPRWIEPLMRLRDGLVTLIGLKGVDAHEGSGAIHGFPVVSESESRLVLGFDDRHLDFRIVVAIERDPHRARVTTLVHRHNLFGRLYIWLITPFHKAIVRSMMRSGANGG